MRRSSAFAGTGRPASGLALLTVAFAFMIGPAAALPTDLMDITETNAKTIKAGKPLAKNTPLKLSETEWVRFSDRGSGATRLCVGKYEGQLQNCPAARPCGLLNMIADECGKNGIALP